jgi:hypothetical protein
MDSELAKRQKVSRMRSVDLEERDRQGFHAEPQRIQEYRPWEEIAAWPED